RCRRSRRRRPGWRAAPRTPESLWPWANCASSLGVDAFGRDLDDDPGLAGPVAAKGLARVQAGQLVDVLSGALQDQLGPAADGEDVSVRLGGVEDHDRDPLVAFEVARLEAWERGVEVDELAVRLDPDDRRLRAPVGHHGGHGREVPGVEDSYLPRRKTDHH